MGTKNNPGAFDCYANALHDEPMFILLGRDKFAAALVKRWAELKQADDHNSKEQVAEAFECANAMWDYCRSMGRKPKSIIWDIGLRNSVVQPWVSLLSMMQQTVLLEMSRGPDGLVKYHPAKYIMRWLRRCILVSAMDKKVFYTPYDRGGGSFTGPSFELTKEEEELSDDPTGNPPNFFDWRMRMDQLVARYLQELDGVPHHFHMHLMHAAEILGYKHPDIFIRTWWKDMVYIRLVHDAHLWPETEEQLDRRLGDSREQWLERADPATQA